MWRRLMAAVLFMAPLPIWGAYDLESCFKAALKRSEALAIQLEQVEQAEERYRQASGSLFPGVAAVASYTRLPAPKNQATAFTRPERPEARLTATQPLFRGLREFAALKRADIDARAAQDQKSAAVFNLYVDVAGSFYQVLELEQDLKNVNAQIELFRERVTELKARRRIGRSRPSELMTVEASVATLESEAAGVRAQLASAREAFVFLTGLERTSEIIDREKLPVRAGSIERYLKRIDQRPDVAALAKRVDSADQGVGIARGAHLPTIDVTGNYYLKRTGVLEDQKWDVVIAGSLPIFSGGAIQSQVREAVSVRRAAELGLAAGRRKAEQEIRVAWQLVEADRAQLEALDRAVALSERNYNEQNKEYRLGLVTNLDVLQSLNASHDARRRLDRARYQARLDLIRLEAAAAMRPREAG